MKGFVSKILFIVLLAHLALGACPSSTYVDSYTNLPKAPVYPTDTLSASLTPKVNSSNPLTEVYLNTINNHTNITEKRNECR